MLLDFEEGFDILSCAWDRFNEERIFTRWVFGAQFELSYDDFKKRLGYKSETKIEKPKSEEEILAEVKGIIDGSIRS